ncbi:unnamed protein product [Ambrosiozyma monospora]|uniref:Unnamed protein product n=1 Tax=Ambrosiozyma monospora TaxID=43982 RepID=A0A9W6WDE3_AMBMO|nr:unnamed protein product [Ambrosiozyma monospora]
MYTVQAFESVFWDSKIKLPSFEDMYIPPEEEEEEYTNWKMRMENAKGANEIFDEILENFKTFRVDCFVFRTFTGSLRLGDILHNSSSN